MKDYSTLIEKLTQRFELERIYHFSYPFIGEEKKHLLLVMGVKGTMSPNVMHPMVKLSLAEESDLSFSIIPYGEWKNNLRLGCLFFVQAARQKNLLYHYGKKKQAPFTVSDLNGVCELVKSVYPSAKAQSEEFIKGVYFYLEQGNALQATFMLHQAIEIRLKSLIQILLGRTNAIHSIQQFIKALSKYIPEFQDVFRKNYEYDRRLLQLLDKAYTSVRRNGSAFEIDEEDLTYLRGKAGELCNAADSIFEHMLSEIGHMIQEVGMEKELPVIEPDKCVSASNDSKRIVNDLSSFALQESIKKQLNRILNSIEKDYPVEQILLIRSEVSTFAQNGLYIEDKADHFKKAAFFVLAVTKENIETTYFLRETKDVNMTVLFYSKKAVKSALGKGSRFVTEIYQRNTVLRQSADFDNRYCPREINWSEVYDKVNKEWEVRKARIEECIALQAEYIQSKNVHTEFQFVIMGHAVEQMCLAWIRCGTGYSAFKGRLRFLIDLSKITSPELYQILHPTSDEEGQLRLCWIQNQILLRKAVPFNMDPKWSAFMHELCQEAYTLTREYCEAELAKLSACKEAALSKMETITD